MTNSKQEQINEMLSIIMESSHSMPDSIFRFYMEQNRNPKEKIFFNLIADSYLTLFSFCKLMFERAWSQAFALLRVGLEQIAAVCLLSKSKEAIEGYIKLHEIKADYVRITDKKDKAEFLTKLRVKRNRANEFFDYSWVSCLTPDKSYGRNQLLELARLEEFRVDIEETINAFSHGSISVFQMDGDNWNTMKRYGRRASLICCKLYDFLCCSCHSLFGDTYFENLEINAYFVRFKEIYLSYSSLNK